MILVRSKAVTEYSTPHYRGIDALMSALGGTIDQAIPLTTLQDPDDIRPGWSVYVGDSKLAVVALAPEMNDSREELLRRLPKLRRQP